MLKVLGDAYVAADTGQVTLLSLLDLSAAFDTVDHPILAERLWRSFGVAGRSLLTCSPSCVLLHDLYLGCQTVLQSQQSCLTHYIGSVFLTSHL